MFYSGLSVPSQTCSRLQQEPAFKRIASQFDIAPHAQLLQDAGAVSGDRTGADMHVFANLQQTDARGRARSATASPLTEGFFILAPINRAFS